MEVQIKEKISSEELKTVLQKRFQHLKVKSPLLNKNLVLVQDGGAMVSVKNKNGALTIKGGINTQNIGIAVGIGVGAIAGLIGAFIFLGIVWLLTNEKFKKLEEEVGAALIEHFSLVE